MRRTAVGMALLLAVWARAEEPLSGGECLAFARAIDAAVGAGDVAELNRLVDWDAILATVTAPAGKDVDPEFPHGFVFGFKESLAKSGGAMGSVRLLTELGERFGYEMRDLGKIPVYAEFVKSPAYEAWLKRPKK